MTDMTEGAAGEHSAVDPSMEASTESPGLSRRKFLGGGLAVGAAAMVGLPNIGSRRVFKSFLSDLSLR